MALDKNSKGDATASELDNFGVWVKNPPETEPSDKAQFLDDSASFDDMFETIESESIETDETPANRKSVPKAAATSKNATDAILKQIASELSALKIEVNALKADIEALKSRSFARGADGIIDDTGEDFSIKLDKSLDESLDDNPSDGNLEKAGAGFFNDGGEDETIALSGDELQNILTNSEFPDEDGAPDTQDIVSDQFFDISEEKEMFIRDESEPLGGLPEIDFENEKLEEPELDDFKFDETADGDDTLPDEIEIPGNDDILVESSGDDGWHEIDESAEFEEINDIPCIDDIVTVDNDAAEFLAKEPESVPGAAAKIVEQGAEEELDDTPTEKVFEKQWGPTAQRETPDLENGDSGIDRHLVEQIKTVLTYMDQLLENLPEKKIEEFAHSEHFESYKKLFNELGIS
jgi:hypothetical protein